MLKDIVEATPLEGYRVRLRFEDGVTGDVDISILVRFEGVFAPLKDPMRLRELRVHPEVGTIYWPNGAGNHFQSPLVRAAHEDGLNGIASLRNNGIRLLNRYGQNPLHARTMSRFGMSR